MQQVAQQVAPVAGPVHWRPAGYVRIADKLSDAVVYIGPEAGGKCGAIAYHGKAERHDFWFNFKDEARRERKIREHFEWRRAHAKRQAERRAEKAAARAKGHGCEVGHIFYSSWGYEQTNIDWYEVIALVGKSSVKVRKISAVIDHDMHDQGSCSPRAGAFVGPEMVKRIDRDGSVSFKVASYAHAFLWDGKPKRWSSYH